MKRLFTVSLLLILISLLAVAGCSDAGSSSTDTTTPTATVAPTQETTVAQASMVPGPTQSIPANQGVSFEINQDPITADISVGFAGGLGQAQVSDITAKATYPDGTTDEKSIQPLKGDAAIFKGLTNQPVRIEVTVMLGNVPYKVVDELVVNKRTAPPP